MMHCTAREGADETKTWGNFLCPCIICALLNHEATSRIERHLKIPEEAGQEGPPAVREHGSRYAFACHLTLKTQPVSSTCNHHVCMMLRRAAPRCGEHSCQHAKKDVS